MLCSFFLVGSINTSLLTLGSVISKLLDGSSHIPFRDSKLTRILQTSFGGNARTAVICAVTTAPQHTEETVSTMCFANKVKAVSVLLIFFPLINVRLCKCFLYYQVCILKKGFIPVYKNGLVIRVSV